MTPEKVVAALLVRRAAQLFALAAGTLVVAVVLLGVARGVGLTLLLGRRAIFRGHEGVRQWLVEFAEAVPLEPHAGSYQVSKLDDRRFELLVEIVVDGEPRASVSCMIRTNELGLIAELRSRLDALAGDT